MERLTTNDPQGNVETAHNLFYAKDTEVWVRGGGAAPDYADITLYDFIRQIVQSLGPMSIDTSVPDEELGEELYELLFDGTGTIEGLVATLYTAAWAFADLRKRLASYEDTGLTPTQIKSILPKQSVEEAVERMKAERERYDEWFAWKQAEQEGRLLVLPCKVGTPIYWINFNQHDGYWIELGEFHLQDIGVFGKTIFLTREAAEAKLEECEGT